MQTIFAPQLPSPLRRLILKLWSRLLNPDYGEVSASTKSTSSVCPGVVTVQFHSSVESRITPSGRRRTFRVQVQTIVTWCTKLSRARGAPEVERHKNGAHKHWLMAAVGTAEDDDDVVVCGRKFIKVYDNGTRQSRACDKHFACN